MRKRIDKKPWGQEEIFTLNKISSVKILVVEAKKRTSLQYHRNRKEFWHFLDNPAKIIIGNKTFKATKGSEFLIPRETKHRIRALNKNVRLLELSFGKFDERDIVRLKDDYGRA